jgi:integrase
MRRSEVLGLRWEQVNFLSGTIVLLPGETKNDEGRNIPIVPQLRTMLMEQFANVSRIVLMYAFAWTVAATLLRLERSGKFGNHAASSLSLAGWNMQWIL